MATATKKKEERTNGKEGANRIRAARHRVATAEGLLRHVRKELEAGDAPAPLPRAVPDYGNGGVARVVNAMLLGGYGSEEIFAEVRKRFPESTMERGAIHGYRATLRRKGLLPPEDEA